MSFVILDNVGYELESKTLFRNMTSLPDSGLKRIINTLVKQLKADGNWNLLDALWMTASHHQQAARLNWMSPGNNTLTEINAPGWVALKGYTGNGTTNYLNSNFNPATQGVNFLRDDSSIHIYSRSNIAENRHDIGSLSAATVVRTILALRYATNVAYSLLQTTATSTIANSDSSGLFSAQRTASNLTTLYRNGSSIGTTADVSSAVVSLNAFICASNNNGTVANLSTKQIAMAAYGSGSINNSSFYNAIQSYMTAIGANV